MANKLIRIASLLEKKHKATLADLHKQDLTLQEQLQQVDMLNKHSQTIVAFEPNQQIQAANFKQSMYYRENLNTLLVAQYREISTQRKNIRNQEQDTKKQLQKSAILTKLGEKQDYQLRQEKDRLEIEELNSSVLLRNNCNNLFE